MTDIKQIEAALTYIPAHDRDVWWKVGMSVKSELGEEGFPLWSEWGASADTYKQADARAVWKSLKASGPVTIASLFGLAKEHGYRPEHPARPIDPAEIMRRARERQEAERIERENTEASYREAAKKAVELWNKANPHPDPNHAYLVRKGGLPPLGIRQMDNALVVPVHGADKALTGLQFIQPDGQKRFITGTRKAGSWCVLKPEGIPPADWSIILVAEGWATAASLHTATGLPVFIAFDCGNLSAVAQYIRRQFPAARLLFCADDDAHGKGQNLARLAAHLTNGMAIIPRWEGIPNMTPEQQAQATDFNDLHVLAGLDAVRAQIDDAVNNWRQEQAEPANDSPEESERQQRAGKREKPPIKPAKAYSIAEFLSITLPPRINLLSPWMPAQGLAMVYAPRGIGKTFFGLNVAYAVASGGSFLCWKAEAPMRVMYIDGEMPAVTMQERLASIVNSHEAEAAGDALLIVTPDMQDGEPMPDLSTIEGQAAIAPLLEGVRLIVVDNISTLCRTGTENESDSWDVVQMWALKQRSAGRSVLFVHHAGKTGAQRGTSKREDVLDTVIALRRPGDYSPGQGAAFEVHFEKARGFSGDDAEPMLCALDEDEHGKAVWTWRKLELATFDKVVSLANEGLTPVEIAEQLDVNKSTVSRHMKKARSQGLLRSEKP